MQANLKNFKSIKKIVRLASVTCVALAIYGCSSTDEEIDQENAMTPEQQQLFILEKIKSWSAAEPDIQRVLSLEADMQLIVNQLASMAELNGDPLQSEEVENTENIQNKKINKALDELPVNMEESNVKTASNNIEQKTAEESKSTDSISIQQPTYSSPRIASNVKSSSRSLGHNLSKKNNNVKTSSKSSGHNFPKVGIHIAMFKNINTIPIGWQYLQSILPAALANKKPLLAKVNYEDTEYYSLRVGPFKSANTAKKTCLNLQQQQHYCSVVEYKGFSFSMNAR